MNRSVFTRRLGTLCLVATVGCMAIASSADATLVWYDGFTLAPGGDYTTGVLGGQTGGSDAGSGTPFFTGAWTQAGGDDSLVLTDNLQRPGPITPSVGGSMGDADIAGCCITQRTSRLFTDPWSGFTNPDATYYIGFLIDYGASGPIHHRVMEMHDGGFDDNLNRNLQLGYSEFSGVGTTLTMRVRDSSVATPPDNQTNYVLSENLAWADDGETHLMVMKFELSTSLNDVISVYLDPVGLNEPGVPSAVASVGEFLADRMGLAQFTFGSNDQGVQMDEIRVGTTFADVANNRVPEPATLSLIALGVAGLCLSARRKRS